MRACSLFSGVGGLDLGLEQAGIEITSQCESDAWKRSILAAHWPGVPCAHDVRDVGEGAEGARPGGLRAVGGDGRGGDALDARPRPVGGGVDLLCGGFPCQDVSIAGRRAGLAGARSGLFHEFARIADALRPAWLLVENVPGLLTSNDGRDFGVILGTLADLGYGVAWRVLDARYFGVPQRRRRVFLVGHSGGDPARALRALCESCGGDPTPVRPPRPGVAGGAEGGARGGIAATLRSHPRPGSAHPGMIVNALVKRYGKGTDSDATDALLVTDGGADVRHAQAGHLVVAEQTSALTASGQSGEHPPGGGMNAEKAAGGHLVAFSVYPEGGQGADLAAAEIRGAAPPLSAVVGRSERGVRLASAQGVRRLTPVECERLMGWPDNFTAPPGVRAPDSRRYAACGDGVVAPVARWIGERIMREHARP